VATREDFDDAAKLYGLLNGTTGGQATKLTKKESDLVSTIQKEQWPEFIIVMLQRVTGLSNGSIDKLMHGYGNRGSIYSGLLEKCPAIAYTDRTVVGDDEYSNVTMRRQSHAYTFDQDLFRAWFSGGYVWIDHADEDADHDPDDNPDAAAADANHDDDDSIGNVNLVKSLPGEPSPATSLQVESDSFPTLDPGTAGESVIAGCNTHFQSCNSVAGFGNDISPVELKTASTTTHLDVPDPLSCNKPDLMGPHHHAQDYSHHSPDDPKHVAGLNSKSFQNAQISEPLQNIGEIGLHQELQPLQG